MMPATGGSYTESLPGTFGCWYPKSGDVLLTANAGLYQTIALANAGFNSAYVLQGGSVDSHPTPSPDGSTMAFVQQNGTTSTLVTAVSGHGAAANTIVTTNPAGDYPNNPSWSPFLSNRSFVGASGALATTAAGFLWSQVNSSFASLLTFSATTAASATATSQTSGGSGAIVYLLAADNITSLSYTNGYYIPKTTVAASTPQVLVTVDGTSGQIATVAPFISAKPAAAGGALGYTGKFSAVYDAQGHNLAPNGASAITLDRKTGKLVSARDTCPR
jgi:hypothetical protein